VKSGGKNLFRETGIRPDGRRLKNVHGVDRDSVAVRLLYRDESSSMQCQADPFCASQAESRSPGAVSH
jgi:hypothetical protein